MLKLWKKKRDTKPENLCKTLPKEFQKNLIPKEVQLDYY